MTDRTSEEVRADFQAKLEEDKRKRSFIPAKEVRWRDDAGSSSSSVVSSRVPVLREERRQQPRDPSIEKPKVSTASVFNGGLHVQGRLKPSGR